MNIMQTIHPRSGSTLLRQLSAAAGFLALACTSFAAERTAATTNYKEPDFESAKNWFPPLRNVWTAVGVKSHPFRFTLLYNGWIVAEPSPIRGAQAGRIKTYLDKYIGLGFQLSFTPNAMPPVPARPYQLSSTPDHGVGLQGWDDDHTTPVLWTRWMGNGLDGSSGVVLRQECFAVTAGTAAVQTGQEPLFLWTRFRVEHVDALAAQQSTVMFAHIGNPDMIRRSMWQEQNLTVLPQHRIYPRTLTRDSYDHAGLSCCRLVEPDGKIRLIAMTSSGSALLSERGDGTRDYFLRIEVPAKVGACVDLLMPFIPVEPEVARAAADIGFDAALAASDRLWSQRPATAAVVDTPEPHVNRAVRRIIDQAEVITETNPETQERALLTGSWNYDTFWPTPSSMAAHMLLDQAGYFDFTASHLEIFRTYQGSAKPPGDAYTLHPGYFCAPRKLSSIDWLTDHGAVLQAISEHALLSGDKEFIDHWLEPILKACAFIRDSRAITNHTGCPGVLPPAVGTDEEKLVQSTWNISWNYKGLDSAVRLLERLHHPDAPKYRQEAREYKEVFGKAFRQFTATMPSWTNDAGVVRKIVPYALAGDQMLSHPFNLDCGPMVLAYAGLLDGSDPLMQNAMAYYREGPNTKLYDVRGNMKQRAVLIHEISSCEPCYSFNILCSWQAGDRAHFLEGMYGILAGDLSQQTFSGCEHRHGIFAVPAPSALWFYTAKLSVIDDALKADELHLLRLTPLAWIKTDYTTRFENMPTEYGPVDLKFGLSSDGRKLNVTFKGHWRTRPNRVVLHIPPVAGLKSVVINGSSHRVNRRDEIILD